MFIHEAAQVALEIDGFIVRRKYANRIRIKPTDGSMRCVLHTKNAQAKPGWEPTGEDLTADDWMVTTAGMT